MSKTRAIRLTKEDDKKIEAFIKANPIFDFSSLARHSILSFMENPSIKFKTVKTEKPPTKEMLHGQ